MNNVERALETLQKEYGNTKVRGVVCHVSKKEDRQNLIQEVNFYHFLLSAKILKRMCLVHELIYSFLQLCVSSSIGLL